ncbi:MAG: UvrD-helicase domain-containing protein [Bacteroidales bacterium]|nr:UvrD-helicase domain-containing protein [Bacteroidales bacterium]
MITILKASAGSGKTYHLTRTYIRLLLCNPSETAYRHILAVTFTNKATDEMKNRILEELHQLASDPAGSHYLKDFVPSDFPSAAALQQKAARVLSNLLHDYGAFSVSTIDRFFQQTLKAFSHELGIYSSYKVELDRPSLVEESVSRVLDSVSEQDRSLLDWLSDMAMEQIGKGERYSLLKNLSDKAGRLMSEELRNCREENGIGVATYSRESLRALRRLFRKVMDDTLEDLRASAAAVRDAFAAAGFGMEETSRGVISKNVSKFLSVQPGDPMPALSDAFLRGASDYDSWWKKADKARAASAEGVLAPPVQALVSAYGTGLKHYNTAQMLSRQIGDLGILTELQREFDSLVREKNVVCLDDANHHLREIIDGSDTPFIYEKMGVRYDHFLLDEFQDTSRIQWDNFRPLIANSDAQGFGNLVVGDVKQSIYRWRNSDWKLMAEEVGRAFPDHADEALRGNWRSLRNIVGFNNGFFAYAAGVLDRLYGHDGAAGIARLYDAGVCDDGGEARSAQKVCRASDDAGRLSFVFTDADRQDGYLLDAVRGALDAGARPGDIAVLVRDNEHGKHVAVLLADAGIDVLSDEALCLSSSPMVRQLVSLISCVGNPEDTVGSWLARQSGLDALSLRYRSLPDLCEQLIRLLEKRQGKEAVARESRYLFAFMDVVQDFTSLNGHAPEAFLKYWKEKEPDLSVSSPADADAVRVMTVHKAKGLEFPYVIFPYVERVTLFRQGHRWSVLRTEGTPFAPMPPAAFDVNLSGTSLNTLFDRQYLEELRMQYIDNLNLLYVALTRPSGALTVISTAEAGEKNCAMILRSYLDRDGAVSGFEAEEMEDGTVVFRKGAFPDFAPLRKRETRAERLEVSYASWPLNPEEGDGEEDVRVRGRLKFSADAVDFFSEEAALRPRRNGIVLHGILSSVTVPGDLPGAVEEALRRGDFDRAQAEDAREMLSARIAAHPEWFPAGGAQVLAETTLIDTDGQEYRPDRVVIRDGRVTVIDYKFGAERPAYARQVARYADIYRRMGHAQVETVLWYVPSDRVVRGS